MKLNKLSNALSPLNLSASSVLDINNDFQVTVVHLNTGNQVYNARVVEHVNNGFKAEDGFFNRLWKTEYFPEAIDFVANVLMLDWKLIDDDSNSIPFTVETAKELLNNPHFGQNLYSQVVLFAIDSARFKGNWQEVVTKN